MLPFHDRFRLALEGAYRALAAQAPGRLGAMLALAPSRLPPSGASEHRDSFPAPGVRRATVALLAGCAQRVLALSINDATIRLLNRLGVEVTMHRQTGCCGAIVHHLGKEDQARALAIELMTAWLREIDGSGLDAIAINASGCGTEIKDYGHIFRNDPVWAEPARRISALARDISEYVAELGLQAPIQPSGLTVAYHAACSLQHGQRVKTQPKALLEGAGFIVRDARGASLLRFRRHLYPAGSRLPGVCSNASWSISARSRPT